MNRFLFLLSVLAVSAFSTTIVRHADEKGVDMHTPFRWIFTDSTARKAAITVKRDTTKICLQLSDYSIWVLKDTFPSWRQMDGNKVDSLVIRAMSGNTKIDSATVVKGIGGTLKVDSVNVVKGIGGTTRLDSVTIAKGIGGTLKVDSINSIKGIKAPVFTGVADSAKKSYPTSSASGDLTGTYPGPTVAHTNTSTLLLGDSLNVHGTVIQKNGYTGFNGPATSIIQATSQSAATTNNYTPILTLQAPAWGSSAYDGGPGLLFRQTDNFGNLPMAAIWAGWLNGGFSDQLDLCFGTSEHDAGVTKKMTLFHDGTLSVVGAITAPSISGSSGSCTGNAATASSCTGNAATASSCTGNAATATTATNQSGGTVSATTINASSLTILDSVRTGKGIYTPSISGPFGSVRLNGNSSTSTLQLDGTGNGYQFNILNSYTPLTSGASGQQGGFAWDSSYLYIYTGSVWKRVALSSF